MKILKGYVRNQRQPEGSIAKCYIVEQAIEFCLEYLSSVEAIGIPKSRCDLDIGDKGIGDAIVYRINCKQRKQAHRMVLQNTIEVQPYIE